ncbi:MAG TPA: M1 family aminopeptidase [Kofleriaceae bacterium]|nr:M1 family aminopeptidase [Kofleriaceae bacterium]
MRTTVPLLLLLATACGAEDDAGPPPGQVGFQVLHYDYSFDLESRQAAVVATLLVEEPGDCVSMPMRAHDLADVTLAGEPLRSGTLEDGVLTACGRVVDAGEEVALTATMTVPLETWGDSQVGYSITTDAEGAPFHYLVSWVGGCDRFGPCDAAPDRFATYRFTVRHPPGTSVLCPGVIEPGESETVCTMDHRAPTYSGFGLAAGPSWVEVPLGDWGGVRATLYDMPSVDMAGAIDVDVHARFFAWMVERFGPYPYGDELRFFVGPTYWAGFEHPGNIALSDGLVGLRSSPIHTLHHELVHQWAGDQTTLASVHDFVWKEAMAEYLTFVFEEEEMSQAVGLGTARYWKAISTGALYHPVPLEQPPLLDFYSDVYGPGPMVLFRQIEALFGRDAVLAALGELLGEERALSVADVKAALEQATGADLDGYIEDWVVGEGAPVWPRFSLAWTQEGAGEVSYTLTQEEPEAPMGCAFALRLTGAAEESHDVWIDLGPDGVAELTGSAAPGFAVAEIELDPDAHCLATRADPAAAPARRVNPFLSPRAAGD